MSPEPKGASVDVLEAGACVDATPVSRVHHDYGGAPPSHMRRTPSLQTLGAHTIGNRIMHVHVDGHKMHTVCGTVQNQGHSCTPSDICKRDDASRLQVRHVDSVSEMEC
jgi:hypothetical protein